MQRTSRCGLIVIWLIVMSGISVFADTVNSSDRSNKLDFSVTMEKQLFSKCEDVWVCFKIKNITDSVRRVVLPVFASGIIEIKVTNGKGDAVNLDESCGAERLNSDLEALSVDLSPMDSLMGFIDLASHLGRPITATSKAFCHALGEFSVSIMYVPSSAVCRIVYEVEEPTGATIDEYRAFCEVDQGLGSASSEHESKISSFLANHPNSIYAPEVCRQWVIGRSYSASRNHEQIAEAAKECITHYPNNPVAIFALGHLIQVQSIRQNELYLLEIRDETGTLISVFARQALEHSDFRELSRDFHR